MAEKLWGQVTLNLALTPELRHWDVGCVCRLGLGKVLGTLTLMSCRMAAKRSRCAKVWCAAARSLVLASLTSYLPSNASMTTARKSVSRIQLPNTTHIMKKMEEYQLDARITAIMMVFQSSNVSTCDTRNDYHKSLVSPTSAPSELPAVSVAMSMSIAGAECISL